MPQKATMPSLYPTHITLLTLRSLSLLYGRRRLGLEPIRTGEVARQLDVLFSTAHHHLNRLDKATPWLEKDIELRSRFGRAQQHIAVWSLRQSAMVVVGNLLCAQSVAVHTLPQSRAPKPVPDDAHTSSDLEWFADLLDNQ